MNLPQPNPAITDTQRLEAMLLSASSEDDPTEFEEKLEEFADNFGRERLHLIPREQRVDFMRAAIDYALGQPAATH